MASGIRRTLAAVALVVLAGVPAFAQNDADSPIARELAWGSWIAGRDRDATAIPWLTEIVEARIDTDAWSPPVDFALDALIQIGARLEPQLLGRIARERPIDALVLLSSEPDGVADAVLLDVLARERGYRWFAAANLLLRRTPPGVAARLLTGLRIQVTLMLTDQEDTSWMCGGLGGSIGGGILTRAPGMPPWPSYVLTDGDDLDADEQLLADGPARVAVRRLVAPAGTGPRRGGADVDAPSAHDRLRYLAVLAGPQTLLSGDEWRTMAWYPGIDVRATLVDLRRDVTERHAALVRDLVVAGYVTAEEAAGLTVQVDTEVVDRHTP